MAERPIWHGQLRLALVSCPVALYAAHHERESLDFHFINPGTGHRVRMVTTDARAVQRCWIGGTEAALPPTRGKVGG